MKIDHDIVRPVVALVIGLLLAVYVYRLVTDPEPALRKARQEAVVMASRDILRSYVAPDATIQIVDPVSPDRKVGKVYIYPSATGWEVSGHYRRDDGDRWHPFLLVMNAGEELESLKVRDSNDRLIGMSLRDPKFSVIPP
ncbi:MAG: hypothetical protein ACE5FV_00820 [Woeseia sp.]